MARQARKALADLRAMEEEGERLNPVNPKKEIMGRGATPSMGLSQFRGGGDLEIVHHASDSDSDEEHALEAGRMLGEHIKGLHGAGYLKKFHAGMMGGVNTGAYEGQGRGVSGGAPGVTGGAAVGQVVGGAKKAPSAARKARGAMVSKLMKEKGMSLGEASKYIKEHGMK